MTSNDGNAVGEGIISSMANWQKHFDAQGIAVGGANGGGAKNDEH